MDWVVEIIKTQGVGALGWIIVGAFIKRGWDKEDLEINSRIKNAETMEGFTLQLQALTAMLKEALTAMRDK